MRDIVDGKNCGEKIKCPYCGCEQDEEIAHHYISYHGSEDGTEQISCQECERDFFLLEQVHRNYEIFTQEAEWTNTLSHILWSDIVARFHSDEWENKAWEFTLKYHCSKYWNKHIIKEFQENHKLSDKQIEEIVISMDKRMEEHRGLHEFVKIRMEK